MKKIILVTHGEAEQDIPDPGLTEKGKRQMKESKSRITGKFDYVVSGTGRRHKEACMILVGREADIQSEIAGVSEALSLDGTHMIFHDGQRIPIEEYMKTRYKEILRKIPHILKKILKSKRFGGDTLMIGARITAIGAGINPEKVKSGHTYYITITPSGKIEIRA